MFIVIKMFCLNAQVYPPENQYDQYWSQVNAAPPITPIFLKKEHTTTTTTSTSSTSLPVEDDTSQIGNKIVKTTFHFI